MEREAKCIYSAALFQDGGEKCIVCKIYLSRVSSASIGSEVHSSFCDWFEVVRDVLVAVVDDGIEISAFIACFVTETGSVERNQGFNVDTMNKKDKIKWKAKTIHQSG